MKNNFLPVLFEDKQKKVINFRGLCKGCGICIQMCPVKAIAFSKKDLGCLSTPAVEIDIKKCIACGKCQLHCPDSALAVSKKTNTSG